MAKTNAKYYAVRKGKTPGIYTTWAECERNVHGFPGAIYKSFKTLEEAEEFVNAEKDPWWSGYDYTKKKESGGKAANDSFADSKLSEPRRSIPTDSQSQGPTIQSEKTATQLQGTTIQSEKTVTQPLGAAILSQESASPIQRAITLSQGSKREALIKYLSGLLLSDAIAFVDGSYNIATKEYSYGMLIYHDGELYEAAECYNNEEMSTMRNVAGELEGAMHAMKYCIQHGIESLDLYYDYEGIEKWASGSWKTNKSGTKAYKKYYDSIEDTLTVNFVKVKGHSGDLGNERADELAKQAAGV